MILAGLFTAIIFGNLEVSEMRSMRELKAALNKAASVAEASRKKEEELRVEIEIAEARQNVQQFVDSVLRYTIVRNSIKAMHKEEIAIVAQVFAQNYQTLLDACDSEMKNAHSKGEKRVAEEKRIAEERAAKRKAKRDAKAKEEAAKAGDNKPANTANTAPKSNATATAKPVNTPASAGVTQQPKPANTTPANNATTAPKTVNNAGAASGTTTYNQYGRRTYDVAQHRPVTQR